MRIKLNFSILWAFFKPHTEQGWLQECLNALAAKTFSLSIVAISQQVKCLYKISKID